MTWQTSISREELAGLPIRRYEGEVRLVESAQALADEAAAVRRESGLGLDTEKPPDLRKSAPRRVRASARRRSGGDPARKRARLRHRDAAGFSQGRELSAFPRAARRRGRGLDLPPSAGRLLRHLERDFPNPFVCKSRDRW